MVLKITRPLKVLKATIYTVMNDKVGIKIRLIRIGVLHVTMKILSLIRYRKYFHGSHETGHSSRKPIDTSPRSYWIDETRNKLVLEGFVSH